MDVIINSTCEEVPSRSLPLATQGHYLTNALVALGYEAASPPLADLLRRYHSLAGDWLIASPIHWEATHNDAMIVATGDALELDDSLAKIWFAEVSQLLKEDGFELVYHSPDLWLVNPGNKAAAEFPALHTMLHRSMMPVLQTMDKSMFWQKLLTELQMFMSTHPLNSAKNRAMPINGLWFWGGGTLHANHSKPLISNDAVLLTAFPGCQPLQEQTLPTDSVVVIGTDQAAATAQVLKATARKKRTQWYWSNVAYQCRRLPWWLRVWKR
ncbi:hypothetical protein [Legionella taurinensis]|uniref:Cofactor-independent phosphoglycerate mutase n=1 Tax=Legionella taurinensis TaxID=70611 RepID=A0A3A5LGD1_9GAMM|nr:hypothetical protein [Legionella taurinensis]RJT45583.1 hypothetical protein D6J04_10680 [Legionella taurinensis]RJT66199.1 hypothetical protein D6J03_11325 [Legionella taurinensis]STY26275.1 Uncharacterized protein conserved in bacteria [Legionella taurinensis]